MAQGMAWYGSRHASAETNIGQKSLSLFLEPKIG